MKQNPTLELNNLNAKVEKILRFNPTFSDKNMKSIFDRNTLDQITERIGKLTPNSDRQWGKMSPSQAMEHCARALEAASGKVPTSQAFLGKLIGWYVKRQYLGDKPMPKGSPTSPDFVIKDDPDFDATREKLKSVAEEFHKLGESGTDGNIHGFFGRLSGNEWGVLQYNHLDHHLRQFGC